MALFYMIGHSNRTLENFIALLEEAGVEALADVRTIPRSRANPQFGEEGLPDSLNARGVSYRRFAALGGLRSRRPDVADNTNGFWENRSFHNYADHALGETFQRGLESLIALGESACCAVMCAEAVWWRCHRRIIADYLLFRGHCVRHIMGPGQRPEAKINPAARPAPHGRLIYPQEGDDSMAGLPGAETAP